MDSYTLEIFMYLSMYTYIYTYTMFISYIIERKCMCSYGCHICFNVYDMYSHYYYSIPKLSFIGNFCDVTTLYILPIMTGLSYSI